MQNYLTRRGFFQRSSSLLAALGLESASKALYARPISGSPHEGAIDYYDKLGVTKIINAAGTYTFLTASIMPPSVQAAVAVAAKHPVRLDDLQKAAGEYLARKLHCQGALVTAGAASALTLGTAACVTLGNQKAVEAIPTDLNGLKTEVLIQKAHRYDYDHALRNCGIRFVEVETLQDYRAAFNTRTVMAHFYNAAENGQISRQDWIRAARQHGVPCFNDAAADVPPISNLWNYTQMGFDLVTFSGGKGMRGPQNAGLLLGRKDLIDAAQLNNNPISDTVGRGMKVAKEQIVGMVAAVDWFLSETDAGMEREFRRRAELIRGRLQNLPTIQCQIVVPAVANHVPHLLIRYDQKRIKLAPLQVAENLRQGTPSIELNPATGLAAKDTGMPTNENTIVVGVWMLQPGEDLIVAKRLREVLRGATQPS
ncbi:MAG: aminotransferase class V-fold PLP-dependent enzyme [Terriglobia bacterium]